MNKTFKHYFTLSAFLRLIAAAMLFYALKDRLKIDYFTILRFVVCAVAALSTYLAFRIKSATWITLFALMAALFNPFFPVILVRKMWTRIDVISALVLLISIFYVQETFPKTEIPKDDL